MLILLLTLYLILRELFPENLFLMCMQIRISAKSSGATSNIPNCSILSKSFTKTDFNNATGYISIGKTLSYCDETTKGRSSPWVLVSNSYSLLGVNHDQKALDKLNFPNPGNAHPKNSG